MTAYSGLCLKKMCLLNVKTDSDQLENEVFFKVREFHDCQENSDKYIEVGKGERGGEENQGIGRLIATAISSDIMLKRKEKLPSRHMTS